jgi:hypothetical protein
MSADAFVVRHDVARDEVPESVEYGLGERDRPFDLAGLP